MRDLEQVAREHAAFEARPVPATIGDLLSDAIRTHGDATFLNFFEQGETLTFRQAGARIARLADGFSQIGIGRGTHVAVMLPNIAAFPLTWLALARLGAVMVPVNNRYTARELRYVTGDAEARFLVIHADYTDLLRDGEEPFPVPAEAIIQVGGAAQAPHRDWAALEASGDAGFAPDYEVSAGDLMNIQYTSGTTGFPKGCMQTHRYWTIAAVSAEAMVDFPITRILCAQFFYYLDPQLFLVMALRQGAIVFVANSLRASKFMPWVREHGIDFVFLFEPVFKQPEHADDANNALKLACTFGFTASNHAALEERFATTAREWYGMTECGSALYMPMDFTEIVGSGSCGIPAPFREVTIRDPETLQPVADGEVGELWVRGEGVMAGYYNKPQANAETFVDGWFRTGDLFRRDENGLHYIVGRVKDMIRRSAENIAAREIEAVLRTHPDIKEAAAVPVPDDYRGEEVKAYIQLAEGVTPEALPPEAIVAHCAGQLAAFKVPRYIAYRASFPYGPADRVEKHKVIAETDDLTLDAYDRVDQVWR